MQSGDNDAIWLMQGWLFTYDPFWRPPQMKALLHSVPVGNLVVLDLFAEVKPIWITSEQFYGFLTSGVCCTILQETLGCIEQNPIDYDLMSEMAFQHNKIAGAAS
ncbi:hypothetical protein KIW84_011155 [Lathyrus oleraceus]|uniref:Alpha-N-acetylglucosaminidase tim-barrel domain-containing protein n=1 Tax=Pisum sativum TaxID=3888 RepID=A0A9D5BAM8_PEA|nr:hypothetical protein KIW84_011155 [Pisum sativum]